MKLANPAAFLNTFGEYCYVDPGDDPAAGERVRLCRKFAYYETHLANMLADFAGSDAAEAVGLEGYVGLREQSRVDVSLCPPAVQQATTWREGQPGSPLCESRETFAKAVSIETKIISDGNWVDIWNSAFADLDGKTDKPPCDYLLASIFRWGWQKARWHRESFKAFAELPPGGKLSLCDEGGQLKGQEGTSYLARWPENDFIDLPAVRWNSKEVVGLNARMFLVLLAPA